MLMTSMLARMPELRRQVQAEHVADTAGHCVGCGCAAYWPCEVFHIAAEAERIGGHHATHSHRRLAPAS